MTQTRPTEGLPRKAVRVVATLAGTAAVAALAFGLVNGGTGLIASAAKPIVVDEAAPPIPVSTTRIVIADSYTATRRFIGQVEAQQDTSLGFEQGGTVAEVLVDEGDRVRADDVLARLDTRALRAERAAQTAAKAALQAQADLARRTTERQEALENRGFSATQTLDNSRFSLAELNARIAQTDAVIAGIDIQLDKAVIRAPFDGQVSARLADPGSTTGAGTPVLSLLEDALPRMRVGLPPRLADTIQPGDRFTVDIDGTAFAASVDRLRADLDMTTRTRSLLLTLDMPSEAPIFGRTGTIHLSQDIAGTGAWVPTAALQEGPRGLWTVLTVANNTVAREAVEMIHAEADRAFVRGTFADGATLITGGPHRVTPGQRVVTQEQ